MPSTTRRPSTGPDRRAAVRQQILEATERLLVGGASFTELGVQRIAAEAGLARSTFYLHFRDKTEIITQLAGDLGGGSFNMMSSWDPLGAEPVESLTRALEAIIAFYRERAHLLAAVIEVAAYDPIAREAWDKTLEAFVELGRGWLKGEVDAGRTADLEPTIATRVIVWGGMQTIANHVATGSPDQDSAVAHELALLQWYGTFRRQAGTG